MRTVFIASYLVVAFGCVYPGSVNACGFGKAPTLCDDCSLERAAKWMRGCVVTALEKDKALAMLQFARCEAGFCTADTYVFCIGLGGVMSAHPSAILQGQDVCGLHDDTDNHYIAIMLETAKSGQVKQVSYRSPVPASPGRRREIFNTCAGD